MLSNLFLKIVRTMKVHIQSNLKVPHSTLVALAISASITVIVFGILYMADTGTMGIVDADGAIKYKPKKD
jgi:predicted exporter